MQSPLTGEEVVGFLSSLVKDRSSSSDPMELLRTTLDLCRSAVSLLEQEVKSRHPAKRCKNTAVARAGGATWAHHSGSSSVLSSLSAAAPALTSRPSTQHHEASGECTSLLAVSGRAESEIADWCACVRADVEAAKDAMKHACTRGYLIVCRWFIHFGVCSDVNKPTDADGATPLHIAVYHGHLPVVRYLTVDANANVNQPTAIDGITGGCTALFIAVQNQNYDLAHFLASEANADVNQGTIKCGATPLMVAASNQHLKLVRYIIQMGADVNSARKNGDTAFGFACDHGNVEICGRLLIAGATPQPRDFEGYRQPRKAQVLNWVAERLACHHCFVSVVLFGMLECSGSVLSMIGVVLEVRVLMAQFLNIQTGRELRNLRASMPALKAVGHTI